MIQTVSRVDVPAVSDELPDEPQAVRPAAVSRASRAAPERREGVIAGGLTGRFTSGESDRELTTCELVQHW
jgi:hypothetical protein